MPSSQAILKHIDKYHNKATVVRQIQSNIAETKRKWDIRHTVATIILGAIFTFTGFTGTDRIFDTVFAEDKSHIKQALIGLPNNNSASPVFNEKHPALDTATSESQSKGNTPKTVEASDNVASSNQGLEIHNNDLEEANNNQSAFSKKSFDFAFNLAALLLFILSILNLIYRWKDEHTIHFQGVVKLTAYLNWLEELKLIGVNSGDVALVKEIRGRYQAIVEALPPNDEKDYRKAKNSLALKEARNTRLTYRPVRATTAYTTELDLVKGLITESPLLMTVLLAIRSADENLWLGGGAIRNHIWDKLSGRVTPQDDFDIVYFDEQNQNPGADVLLENHIAASLPSVLKISVKNQARMHLINGEPATRSFEESIAQWPEIATSIAVRLNEDNGMEFTIPYGVSDLLNMVVQPTPYHAVHRNSYNARKAAKAWNTLWPELTVQP